MPYECTDIAGGTPGGRCQQFTQGKSCTFWAVSAKLPTLPNEDVHAVSSHSLQYLSQSRQPLKPRTVPCNSTGTQSLQVRQGTARPYLAQPPF